MTSRIFRSLVLASLLFLAGGEAKAAGQISASYAVYVHGLHALNAETTYQTEAWGYAGTTHIHQAGLLGLFVSTDIHSRVEGDFTADGNVKPIRYESSGQSRGQQRRVLLTYNGSTPHVDILSPAESDREPIPATDLPNTVDTISGLARLLQTLSKTGQCNGSATIFDGLRLTRMTVHGPFQTDIPQSHNEAYSGQSLRCDFVGQQIGGFIINSPNQAKMASPQPGSAWFKNIDGIGLVPVRIEFSHPKLGHIAVVMQTSLQP